MEELEVRVEGARVHNLKNMTATLDAIAVAATSSK